MPIKFRCSHCRQFLGISPSKAGELTDCPACGRTVRVPNLDGTVASLPSARIDPRDAQLAEALNALSRIGDVTTATGTAATVVAARTADTTKPPPAVAVPVQPPLPADRVPPDPAPVPDAQAAGEVAPDFLFIPDDPADAPLRAPRRHPRTPALRMAVFVLAAVALLLAGFFAGRTVERRAARPTPQPAAAPQAARPAAAIAQNPQPAPVMGEDPPAVKGIAGTITWQTADGQMRTDGGARIIAFPAARPAQPSLAVAGFRAGAAIPDRDRATAAIQDAGGDFVIADDTGRYALRLPPGRYDLLFLSRHQPRNSSLPLETPIAELLAAYFDQPSGLAGSVAVAHKSVDFNGAALPLDHAFAP